MTEPQSPTTAELAADYEYLRRLNEDETLPVPAEVAARLEQRGLIMRGWNAVHVVTARGRAVLASD